ncbi:MAG: Extracellular solute-binding protein family 5 [Parcubacteria group bacterium GW2011_GWA2_47_16]|nr:MAG: Extracellular solute-binding protein family 5 [Parcubacteria group bacterium GW2011_GWA2_47_16]
MALATVKEKPKHLFAKNFSIPKALLVEEAVRRFTLTEKFIFYSLAIILFVGTGSALYELNRNFLVEIPSRGGTLTEGVIGLPRFINPILAISDADRDLTALVYSGLLKATTEGTLVPDLAESYSISPDGLTYTFVLKPKLVFHDKTPITADDVVFTVEKAQDPFLKSPKRPNWEGVSVEKVDDRQIKMILKQPYSPFVENLTMGILPKHIWSSIGSEEFPFGQFNVEPVGSGPYKLKSISRNASGIPAYYQLEAFDSYAFGKPLIENIIVKFFQNNSLLGAAYENGNVQSMASISPQQASVIKTSGGRIERTPLPRIFAVFFNENHAPVLANKEVRLALEQATDKRAIVESVLKGEGIAIDSPIPPGLFPDDTRDNQNIGYANDDERVKAAKKTLENAKWKLNDKGVYEKTIKKAVIPLSLSISTSNAPELKAAALMLEAMWEKIGASVDVKISDIGELNQGVIRSRKYDALLFGEIIGRDLDLFAFWHSSQRNDPGLNIALYTNSTADKLLEDARAISDRDSRLEKYRALEKEIQTDIPAIFIYSPDFLYVVPENLRGFSLGHITIPAERFLEVEKWYVETDKVWKVFAPKQ